MCLSFIVNANPFVLGFLNYNIYLYILAANEIVCLDVGIIIYYRLLLLSYVFHCLNAAVVLWVLSKNSHGLGELLILNGW